MKYIKKFEKLNNKSVTKELIKLFKEICKNVHGLIIEKSKSKSNLYILRYGETSLLYFTTLYDKDFTHKYDDDKYCIITFHDDNIKYMLEVENIKEYLLSKLTMKKLKSDDYVINNDEKTRNAILSKYDYELFIATNKYNL